MDRSVVHEAPAIVLGVPVEECAACGQVWLTMETALRLDELFNSYWSAVLRWLRSTGMQSKPRGWQDMTAQARALITFVPCRVSRHIRGRMASWVETGATARALGG